MIYSLQPEAEEEFFEAIAFYESRGEGLGLEFSREIFAAIDRITEFPQSWPVFEGDVRRCLANRFPYGLVYKVIDDKVLIVAVMHLSRDPEYWQYRTN